MTVREWLARVNAVLDILITRQPHFLGEQITIE
jgi:vancomycin permeability regulator SanA